MSPSITGFRSSHALAPSRPLIFPEAEEQRCWNHRVVNVLTQVPKQRQGEARVELRRFRGHNESDAEGGGNDAEYTSTVRA